MHLKSLQAITVLNTKSRNFLKAGFIMIWLLMQVVIYMQRGIVTDLEAAKYIYEAQHFLETGTYSSSNFLFYSVEIMLIALCIKFNISYLFIVILQMLVNGISIICFFECIKKITHREWLAWAGTFYFLIFFYYHLFNTFLFTESLFFSFSVIYTWFLFSIKKFTWKHGTGIFFFLILLYLTRPTGIFFIPATYIFLITRFYPKRAFKIIGYSFAIAVAGFFLLVNYSLGSGAKYNFLLPYNEEMILCGVPTVVQPHNITVPVEKNSLQGIFYIITHYPDLFFSLALKRLSAFLGVSRSFYSTFHNIFLSAYFYLMYLAILSGIRTLFSKNKAEVWFLITNIVLMTVTVMLSCDEWSNRFIFCELPFFLLLAIISISNRKNKLMEKKYAVPR